MLKNPISPPSISRAATTASLALGRLLNAKALRQLQFEPGLSLGGCVVDYVCFERSLVVELSIATPSLALHQVASERRVFLSQQGFLRVPVTRKEILGLPDRVTAKVLNAIQEVSQPFRCRL